MSDDCNNQRRHKKSSPKIQLTIFSCFSFIEMYSIQLDKYRAADPQYFQSVRYVTSNFVSTYIHTQ